jgi:alkanesulfonate monooxygenase SsuD/methylene tetrahydromethanopterin reductase-like flavin-dependent oxidoreductase (luciferase family)
LLFPQPASQPPGSSAFAVPSMRFTTTGDTHVRRVLRATTPTAIFFADVVRLYAPVARFTATSTRIVGTPEQIADALTHWQEAGVDGVDLINAEIPGSYADFVDHVAPERHPAARYRGAFAPLPA